MGFKKGNGRGQLNKGNLIKVYAHQESFWVKLIAIHQNNKYGIGIMQNTMFNKMYKWGELVFIVDDNVKELGKVTKRVTKIPNTKEWRFKLKWN